MTASNLTQNDNLTQIMSNGTQVSGSIVMRSDANFHSPASGVLANKLTHYHHMR
jgi:hypothetical protein